MKQIPESKEKDFNIKTGFAASSIMREFVCRTLDVTDPIGSLWPYNSCPYFIFVRGVAHNGLMSEPQPTTLCLEFGSAVFG